MCQVRSTVGCNGAPQAAAAPLDLQVRSQVDMLFMLCKSVNFGTGKSSGGSKLMARIDWYL